MKNKENKKIYVVRKYILARDARDARDALRLEKSHPVDDVWAEENTHKEHLSDKLKSSDKKLGFK